eukprot:CAMPEP_0202844538 /NCGR_PEP_ID=MMETSP1389-20130828/67578_1 /ASSEMBLY_ACC=CAM_ASM_000865 /TAXON_ID=302021 /ORGANISM="Rhodomonas sp., Strain CCMP768" /LENGTH=166 /DNA_ID=CAMNT_0049521851 /DNA_START=237 /DNA_END=738 /DNA_ORIENTATION=-
MLLNGDRVQMVFGSLVLPCVLLTTHCPAQRHLTSFYKHGMTNSIGSLGGEYRQPESSCRRMAGGKLFGHWRKTVASKRCAPFTSLLLVLRVVRLLLFCMACGELAAAVGAGERAHHARPAARAARARVWAEGGRAGGHPVEGRRAFDTAAGKKGQSARKDVLRMAE